MRALRLVLILLGLALAGTVAFAMLDPDGPSRVAAAEGSPLRAELHRRLAFGVSPGRGLAFSPDGRLLAAGASDGTIRIWRVAERGPPLLFRHQGGATSLAFSGDGSFLATGGYDGNVRLWNSADGRPIRTLTGAKGTIWTVAISGDDTRIASGGEDRTVRLWRAGDGALVKAMKGHELNIWSVRFSPDGAILASSSFDHRIRLWDGESGRPLRLLPGHDQAVVGIAFSPDGGTLASGGDDSRVRLWRVADGRMLRVLSGSNHVYCVAFSPDGQWLGSAGRARGGFATLWHQVTGLGGDGPAVRLWNPRTGETLQTLEEPDDVASIAFSPDGRWLAVSSEIGTLSLWRLNGSPDGRMALGNPRPRPLI